MTGLDVINFFIFCLFVKIIISPLILKDNFARSSILGREIFFFQHFEYIITLPSGMQSCGCVSKKFCSKFCGGFFLCNVAFLLLLSRFFVFNFEILFLPWVSGCILFGIWGDILGLDVCLFPHSWEVFNHYIF